MGINVLLMSSVGYIAFMYFIYFGVTNTSEFSELPTDKQQAGRKKLKNMLLFGFFLGFVLLLTRFIE